MGCGTMINREVLKTFIDNAHNDTKYVIENIERNNSIVFMKSTEPNGGVNILICRTTLDGEWLENIDYKDL